MSEIELKLKEIGLKTMFDISDDELPELLKEYEVFMQHVEVLENIDTSNVDILAYPYEIETTFLREDEASHMISMDQFLENAPCVEDNQIKMPKVVG